MGEVEVVTVEPEGDRRGRRRGAVLACGLAVAAAIAGVTVALSSGAGPGVRAADAPPPEVTVPAGMRLVGLGHAAIAVPVGWGTNKTRCATPKEDTVVIDVYAVEACATGRPAGVESVELSAGGRRFDFKADSTLDIDGVAAERQATSCSDATVGQVALCTGAVYIPSLALAFRAESSTGAAEVDAILGRIRMVPGEVGVPGYQRLSVAEPGGGGAAYAEELRRYGLTADVRTERRSAMPPGLVLRVSPEPGTMLRPGEAVTVTVVAEPEGPQDEVSVGMNSSDSDGDDYHDLTDDQIRAGVTIELSVGARIWAYAFGKRAETLAGELAGTALEVDGHKDGPNYPHRWKAVGPGTTTVALTVTADGRPVRLGVVTVVVG